MSLTKLLLEIDWEDKFSDVKKECWSANKLSEYLNQLNTNRRLQDEIGFKHIKHPDYTDIPIGKPFIHKRSMMVQKNKVDKDGKEIKLKKGQKYPTKDLYDIDIDHFIKQITMLPSKIIKQNEKLEKTGSRKIYVYNTGIPAFRGIVYDKDEQKFYSIQTCPTAGKCVSICYALAGQYIQYPANNELATRTINLLLNDPNKYFDMFKSELIVLCKTHGALTKPTFGGKMNDTTVVIRVNDSGDFFSINYYNLIIEMLREVRKMGYNVKGYAHTKIADIVMKKENDDIFITSFSDDALSKEVSKLIDVQHKKSTTILKDEYNQFDLNSKKGSDEFFQYLSDTYSIPKDKIYYMDDYIKISEYKNEKKPKYYVIVTNQDGDDATYRPDVKQIFHLEH